jgi:hypothetical protein
VNEISLLAALSSSSRLSGSADRLTNLDDLVKDFVLVALDHAPVVGERSDTKTLVLALAALKKVVSVLAEKAQHLFWDRDAERRSFTEFEGDPVSAIASGDPQSERFCLIATIATEIADE